MKHRDSLPRHLLRFGLAAVLAGPLLLAGGAPVPGVARGDAALAQEPEQDMVVPGEFHGDLRDLPKAETGPSVEFPRLTEPPKDPNPQDKLEDWPASPLDSLLERQRRLRSQERAFNPPDLNFGGIPFQGGAPPDPVGDVGADHYIQMTNASVVQIYDKGGTLLAGPFLLESLWTLGGDCANGRGDPIVLYDHLADRWLMSEFATVGNHLCVYISMTGDPVAGGWFNYDFVTPNFPDYPKYAVWPDAYYVSSNEAGPSPAYALDRTNMLQGLPANPFQRFTAPDLAGFNFNALIPSDLDGPPPPAGSPNFFMRHRDDEAHNAGSNDPTQDFLEIWEFSVDFALPVNSSFTQVANIPVAEFDSDLCGLNNFFCFPQPGTTTILDPVQQVIMWRLQYRNFGSHETLVGNFVTDVTGTDQGGIRWFELRRAPPGAGAWGLFQEGTHSPDTDNRWMGSIAMDQAGGIALGYSVSSGSTFPSIRYTGRVAGDPPGTMPLGEVAAINGAFSQIGITRWGDYSSMNVDPVDGCTLWYTNEYVGDNQNNGFGGTGRWTTQIVQFSLPNCNRPPACDANGPYTAECRVDLTLDGTNSSDPDGDALSFSWTGPFTPSPASGATPTVQFLSPTGLKTVDLTVDDSQATAMCAAAVTVQDTLAPSITAPGDKTAECTAPGGTPVDLMGPPAVSDLCDANVAFVNDAPALFPLGVTTVTWTATDDDGNQASDTQDVTVEDTTAPDVTASLTPVAIKDEDDDDDEGRLRIDFAASDVCDDTVTVTAVLRVPGLADIPVVDGQVVAFEQDDDAELEFEDGILEIEAPSLTLVAMATDASGNEGSAEDQVGGASGDDDDD